MLDVALLSGAFRVVAGGLELHVLDEGQHALVSSHEAIRRYVGLPRQQPGGQHQNLFMDARVCVYVPLQDANTGMLLTLVRGRGCT